MRKLFFSTLITLSFLAISGQAQSYRLQTLADQLQLNTNELAERSYTEFARNRNNNRFEIDNLMLTQQLSSSANLFKRMIQDRRPNSEIREMTNALGDLARKAPYSSPNSYFWKDVQNTVADINRELGTDGGFGGRNDNNDRNDRDNGVIGNLNWRGTVDDEVQLVIRGNSVDVKTVSGQAYSNATFNFTSPLPARKVRIEVDKKKGRGQVKVLQQPSRENDFTTVIQIRDKDGGAKDYELEIYWR